MDNDRYVMCMSGWGSLEGYRDEVEKRGRVSKSRRKKVVFQKKRYCCIAFVYEGIYLVQFFGVVGACREHFHIAVAFKPLLAHCFG